MPKLLLGLMFAVVLWGAPDNHSGLTLPPTCVPSIGNGYYNTFYNETDHLLYLCTATDTWMPFGGLATQAPASAPFPSGGIILSLAAACPLGFSGVAALGGKTLVGTLEVSGDVGTLGGSDTLTPQGSVSAPSLTMNPYTPAGSVASIAASATAAVKIGTSGASAAASNHTHAAPAFTGTPATLTGSVAAPSFTGSAGDNRSAFVRVLFCQKD